MKYYDEENNCWIDIRETNEYKGRKQQLRDIWIAVLIVMIFLPLGAQLGLAIITTLAALCYLDEVPYALERKKPGVKPQEKTKQKN